ncbi:MAG: hypothetical protein ABSG01_08930 [Anaerolineales bacterium]|jgi:hypothetical protein
MLNYIGNGDHKIGIPARDLSAEELQQYGGEALLLATGLYAKPAKVSKKAAAVTKEVASAPHGVEVADGGLTPPRLKE